MVCHDLGLPFLSPTVNLYIPPTDFLRFANRLEEYLRCELTETQEEGIPYPVGLLQLPDESVRVCFMHYRSFEEAKAKWLERCRRVDPRSVYIVFSHIGLCLPNSTFYHKFRQLPYENKIMLTRPIGIFARNVVPFYSPWVNRPVGRILQYPHLLSKKRLMDRCNFVKFLNRGYTEP